MMTIVAPTDEDHGLHRSGHHHHYLLENVVVDGLLRHHATLHLLRINHRLRHQTNNAAKTVDVTKDTKSSGGLFGLFRRKKRKE